MTTEVRPCSYYPTFGVGSTFFDDVIDETTSPTEFNEKRKSLKDYSLETGDDFGRHALYQAASYGNTDFASSLCKEGGPKLLELGNRQGLTALHAACKESHTDTAIELLLQGSPINITTRLPFYLLPSGATCLDIAIRAHNTILIVLLKLRGGKTQLPIGEKDKPFLHEADQLIALRPQLTILFLEMINLPSAVNEIINDYATFPNLGLITLGALATKI